jgi:L-iditol 2-dehydrogenase
MKAAVVETGKTLSLREIASPELPTGGALIAIRGCGICGSDLDKLLNRNLEDGVVLGHEVVGEISKLSEEARLRFPHFSVGQRVSVAHHVPCRTCHYCHHESPSMCKTFKATNIVPGGFCETMAITGEHLAHTVFPIPDHISDAAASCIEPLACCLRAVDRLPKNTGNTVLMIGLGFIGLLSSQVLRLKGYETYGIDRLPERVEFAQVQDMVNAASPQAEDMLSAIFQRTEGRGADVVFLSVVNPQTLELALKAVRDGGTLLLFTSYGAGDPILNQNTLYFRELTVITSYSPSLQHLREGYDLIKQEQIRVDALMTHTYPLTELPKAMTDYQHGKALKVFITL